MNALYVLEKFLQAERQLAIGPGRINERLHDAYLAFAQVNPAAVPEHLRAEFEVILTSLTKKPPLIAKFSDTVVSGSAAQTLFGMKSKTAVDIASRIIALRSRLAEFAEQNPEEALKEKIAASPLRGPSMLKEGGSLSSNIL